MIDLQKLNLMFDTLFSDPDIEEKFWDWYTNRNKNISQPPVSGELLFNTKCCANCKHFIDKWPYKSECNFHGNKANITHAEEQCCDNWDKL